MFLNPSGARSSMTSMTPSGPPFCSFERLAPSAATDPARTTTMRGSGYPPSQACRRATGHRGSLATHHSSRRNTSDAPHLRGGCPTRDHRGSGSRSHIGYSQNSGVDSIRCCALRYGMRNTLACGIRSERRPGRDQFSRRGGGVDPLLTFAVTAQFVSCKFAGTLRDGINHEFRYQSAGDDHRSSVEKGRPLEGAPPSHDAVPRRRPFDGEQCSSNARMNAVGSDQDITIRSRRAPEGSKK